MPVIRHFRQKTYRAFTLAGCETERRPTSSCRVCQKLAPFLRSGPRIATGLWWSAVNDEGHPERRARLGL